MLEKPQDSVSVDKSYRKDINGLRGIAVICVLLNHFNPSLMPGGYLGVDIFFVISGYVITLSLNKYNPTSPSQQIASFYKRRLHRLTPALFACVGSSLLITLLLIPQPASEVKIGLTSLIGGSNIAFFLKNIDYFGSNTQLNPFSQTWSLGVEEQFYLVFPWLAYSLNISKGEEFKKDRFKSILLISGLVSFVSYAILMFNNTSAAYYLPTSRLWEITAGCLAYIATTKQEWPKPIDQVYQYSPLFLPIVLLDSHDSSGSKIAATVITVIATSALIRKQTFHALYSRLVLGKFLQNAGTYSYSLYLWHWPLIVFFRWTVGLNSWWSGPLLLTLTVLIARYSYEYIEKRYRITSVSETFSKSSRRHLISTCIAWTSPALIALALNLNIYLGTSNKNGSEPIDYVGFGTNSRAKDCFRTASEGTKDIDYKKCLFINKNSDRLVAFLGDSHTLSMYHLSELLFRDAPVDIFRFSSGGCLYPQISTIDKTSTCQTVSEQSEKYLFSKLDGYKSKSLVIATSFLIQYFNEDYNPQKSLMEIEADVQRFKIAITRLAEDLDRKNSNLLLIAPIPNHPDGNREICYTEWFRPSWAIKEQCEGTSRSFLKEERQMITTALKEIESHTKNLYVFDPFEKFCDSNYCYSNSGSRSLFYDNNHLNVFGQEILYGELLPYLKQKELL